LTAYLIASTAGHLTCSGENLNWFYT